MKRRQAYPAEGVQTSPSDWWPCPGSAILPRMTPLQRILSVGALLLLSGSAAAQTPAPRFADPNRLAKLQSAFPAIDQLMRGFADRSRVPGIAWGIIVDGKLAHLGTAGLRQLSPSAPVESSTVFRIASMSKSFAALSILQLRDAGKLSLDDPAESYVPELKGLKYPTTDSPKITIRLLLTHSAGFPEDNPWGDQQLAETDASLSRMIRSGIPFSTAPGTSYEYSNYGFAILGRIVASVSGMPYPRYLTENVLKPLGMSVTTLEVAAVATSRLALGYRREDNQWLEEPQLPDGAFGPMGGMLTSISDLGRWVALMLDAWPPRDGAETGPLRRSSLREMQQVGRYVGATSVRDTVAGTTSLSSGGYGYGLGNRQTCSYRMSISHGGGLPGFGSLMRWLPDYGVGIIALGNLTYTGWGATLEQAFNLMNQSGGLQPREPQPAPVLVERKEQVTRLVLQWDDRLADGLAAMNLYLDESKDRRKTAIERVKLTAGGNCRDQGEFVVENALRGRWRMRCSTGDLRITVTLAVNLTRSMAVLRRSFDSSR